VSFVAVKWVWAQQANNRSFRRMILRDPNIANAKLDSVEALRLILQPQGRQNSCTAEGSFPGMRPVREHRTDDCL